MFKSLIQKSQKREEGQGLVEYALILVLVAVVVIVVLSLVGPAVGNIFSEVVAALNGESISTVNAAGIDGDEPPGDRVGYDYCPEAGYSCNDTPAGPEYLHYANARDWYCVYFPSGSTYYNYVSNSTNWNLVRASSSTPAGFTPHGAPSGTC